MLNSVLFSLFQQDMIAEVIILDESDIPVCESYQVNQALDLLSLKGLEVRIQRSRRRKGIGNARVRLAEMSSNDTVLMVDDDVVLGYGCVGKMAAAMEEFDSPWVVPSCLLIPKKSEGYVDRPISRKDPVVMEWVGKYPWFLPYFDYVEDFKEKLPVAGTQAILLDRNRFNAYAKDIAEFGRLPREDTYMTRKMGDGLFVSSAKCYHFEHDGQQERSWDRVMFYKIHEGIIRNPDGFRELMT